MGIFDRFVKKQADINTGLFSFLFGRAAPDWKSNDYYGAYKGWVYACVNAIAEEVGSMELHLFQKTADGVKEVENHMALNLLHDVNPHMTSSELLLITQSYLDIVGETFWYLPPGKLTGKPAEIWILDPARISIAKGEGVSIIEGYVYQNDKGKEIPLTTKEVMHFKRFNPLNPWRGMGTVKAAAMAIDIDNYSATWNKNFFYNAAMPSGVLESEGTLTKEQYERIKAEWNSQYRGADNAHKLAILEGGLKFNKISMTQQEMDFLEQRRFSRDEILGIFRVPKTVLGISEDVNRANAEATDYVFASRVIKPRMRFIVDRLNEFYLPLFGVKNGEFFFDFTDPVPENLQEAREERKAGISSGYLTINEVREDLGLPPVENGDEIYQPINLMPIGRVIEEDKEVSSGAVTKERKEIETKTVEKRVRYIQTAIKDAQGKFYKVLLEQKGELLKKLKGKKSVGLIKKGGLDELVMLLFENWEDWIGILHEPTAETLMAVFNRSGKEAVAQVGVDILFDLKNERAVSWLKENSLRHATQIAESLKSDIRSILERGLSESMSIAEIADEIANFYDKQSEWRALRIARTEVIDAYANGSIEGFRQSGVVKMKKWITAGDDRVDPECEMNERDGEIGLDAAFSSGHNAPPVHPNCRCAVAPVV